MEGEITKEEFRATQDIANQAKVSLIQATESKAVYEKQYTKFRKLLSASSKDISLSEIMSCIDKVIVDNGKKIVVEWVEKNFSDDKNYVPKQNHMRCLAEN